MNEITFELQSLAPSIAADWTTRKIFTSLEEAIASYENRKKLYPNQDYRIIKIEEIYPI